VLRTTYLDWIPAFAGMTSGGHVERYAFHARNMTSGRGSKPGSWLYHRRQSA
jgi:hypothetical protein